LTAQIADQTKELEARIAALETSAKDIPSLKTDVAALRTDFDAFKTTAEGDIKDLQDRTKALEDIFNNLVTSVENVATYSPLLGQVVLPGLTPNILAAFYGEASAKGSFPSKDLAKIAGVDQITWSQGDVLGAGDKGYAGSVYLTVNKYYNNIEGVDFSLVNTAGEANDNVKLTVEASNKVIYGGWTRAAENNFYEAKAVISDPEAVDAKIDAEAIKADIKEVWNARNRKTVTSKSALAQLAADLYAAQLNKFPVYGVRASWEDTAADGETKSSHFVTSKPEIVVATVKPLSYSFNATSLPGKSFLNDGIEGLEKIYNKIIDKVVAKIPTVDVDNIDLTIKHDYAANTYTITIPSGNGITAATTVDITETINGVLGGVDGNLDELNDLLAQVKEINKISEQVEGTKDTFASYLNRIVNKFESLFVNHFNQALQPTLLGIQADNTINRVSGIKSAPYICGANTELMPTSYSVEFFAPAFKKMVVVTEINGKAATAADNKALGENLGVILESGNNQKVTISPEKGKVYTVVYASVDYQGVTRERTYYVTGK
jgi:hypothetical protein